MRKVREILRLRFERSLSQRQISASTGVSKGAISEYLRRAAAAGVTWEVARALDDSEVEARLFRYPGRNEPPRRVPIDLPWVHRELRRTGVTLAAAVDRVPGRRSRRSAVGRNALRLQPVLRSVRRLPAASGPVDAPGAPRRREDLHRLLGQEAADLVVGDGRGDRGRALRRGAGRDELHVRGGDTHAAAGGFLRVDGARASSSSAACPRSRCPISCAAPSAALIATTRRSIRRTRSWRSTTTWRSCRRVPAKPRDKAKVEGGGAGGAALDPGVPAQPHLLQPRRAEHGDRRAAREAERHAPSRSWRAAAARPSRRSTARRCGRCRRRAGSWRAGRRPR